MEHPYAKNGESVDGSGSTGLLIILTTVFAIVTVYQFLFFITQNWIFFHVRGINISTIPVVLEIFTAVFDLATFFLLYLAISFIKRRSAGIRAVFLMVIPFLIVAYLACLTGQWAYVTLAPHIFPNTNGYSYGPILNFFAENMTMAIIFAFVCIGALFYMKPRETRY